MPSSIISNFSPLFLTIKHGYKAIKNKKTRSNAWEAPEKGMLGISHYIGVRLVLGVVDVCGHAGGVGLVVRGL